MNNIGFKIENCNSEKNLKYIEEVLNYLKTHIYTPIEFGIVCYSSKPRTKEIDSIIVQKVKEANFQKLNVHLSIDKKILNIAMDSEIEWIQYWKNEFKLYEELNVKYFVIHVTSKEKKLYDEKIQFENILHNIKILQSLTNIPFYMENTYEDIYYYKRLYEFLLKNNVKINFTCDIGHLKVHSKENKNEWLYFLEYLDLNNIKLHFHIHDNDGSYDQHLPLNQIQDIETINFVKTLLKKYETSSFIMENRIFDFCSCLKEKELLICN